MLKKVVVIVSLVASAIELVNAVLKLKELIKQQKKISKETNNNQDFALIESEA